MNRLIIINFSIPESFSDKIVEFLELAEKDPQFQKALGKLSSRYNKKTRTNKLRSAKFRFVIAKYIIERKKQLTQNA